jgi:hypothetical protein
VGKMSQLEKRAKILREKLKVLNEKADNFEIELNFFMGLFKKDK